MSLSFLALVILNVRYFAYVGAPIVGTQNPTIIRQEKCQHQWGVWCGTIYCVGEQRVWLTFTWCDRLHIKSILKFLRRADNLNPWGIYVFIFVPRVCCVSIIVTCVSIIVACVCPSLRCVILHCLPFWMLFSSRNSTVLVEVMFVTCEVHRNIKGEHFWVSAGSHKFTFHLK